MSAPVSLTASGSCCAPVCADVAQVAVPGPAGENGSDGEDGTNGLSAYTLTTANFTVPVIGGVVNVAVQNSDWISNGQVMYVTTAGYFQVTNLFDALHAEIKNLGYTGNAAPTTVITTPQKMTPAGLIGPTGPSGAGTLNDLSPTTTRGDLIADNGASSPAASDIRFGTGGAGANTQVLHADSTQAAGLRWGIIDLTGAATALTGQLPVAKGGTAGANAAAARTNLGAAASGLATASGLTSSATDKVIGRSSVGAGAVEEIPCTATGRSVLASATAALARTAIGTIADEYLLYRNQQTSGTNGGAFNNGAWQTVPLNTEVADTGGNGAIAANIVTLQAGTYRFRSWVSAYAVDSFKSRLFNVDTAAVIAYGLGGTAPAGVVSLSMNEGRFTIAVPTQIRMEAQCTTTNGTDGFGKALTLGTEVYSAIEFWKE